GFLRLAQAHLGKTGVLFVDGYSAGLRRWTHPTLLAAARKWDFLQRDLQQGSDALQRAGIPPQAALRVGTAHVFLLEQEERRRLFAQRDGTGRDKLYRAEAPNRDLFPGLEALPLTHDVFTRPLAADRVFPVLGHVLGPAELRYFGQLAPAFLDFTGGMPPLHPRMTAAVAPRAELDALQTEGWSHIRSEER